MKNILPRLVVGALAALAGTMVVSQTPVAPPPRPPEDRPSLEVTLRFIVDKLNGQGKVGYLTTYSNQPGLTMRAHSLYSDVAGDPATCVLRSSAIMEMVSAAEATADSAGQPGSSHETHTVNTATITIPLKQISKITVEPFQDFVNRRAVENLHPERVATVSPAVVNLSVEASEKVISIHTSFELKGHTPIVGDSMARQYGFIIRDEDTADRLARALTNAVELCGGGKKAQEPF
jgi:hypothetical protein